MREVRGFVFLANREWGDFLYGRAVNGQDSFCNLVLNGIVPFETKKAAVEGVKAFSCEMSLTSNDRVSVKSIEMVIATTDEEICALAGSQKGDMVIIALRDSGNGDIDHQFHGPPSTYHAILSESITTNGFCFYSSEYFREISKKPFEKEILHRAHELHRQGDSMPVWLATIKLGET